MARSTKRDMVQRAEAIYAALETGEKLSAMIVRIAKEHKCSENSIRKQYRVIMEDIKSRSEETREDLRVHLLKKLENYELRAVRNGDLKTAILAVNSQAKISGQFLPPKDNTEKVEEKAPVFTFEEKDNSVPLVAVPDDDQKVSSE